MNKEEIENICLHPYLDFLHMIDDVKNLRFIDRDDFRERMLNIYQSAKTDEELEKWIEDDLEELNRLIKLDLKTNEEYLAEVKKLGMTNSDKHR
jgi:hypothetical protein